MQVVYHLGLHCTDEERLLRCLLRSRSRLAGSGIAVPAPGRYRKVLRDALVALRGQPASRDSQEALLAAILDGDKPERIVFSHEYFLGIPQRAIEAGRFYPFAGRNAAALSNLFPDDGCEFHLAIQNPALLVPALIPRIEGGNYASVMGDADPMTLRWPEVIARLREAAPDVRIVVWCHEDAPLLWPELLRGLSGEADMTPYEGEAEFIQGLMTDEGFAKMERYLTEDPPRNTAERRRILAVFLGRYARPGALEQEVAVPGWTDGLVDAMGRAYDADIDEIAMIPGVEVMLP
jgi:hypothetical protein